MRRGIVRERHAKNRAGKRGGPELAELVVRGAAASGDEPALLQQTGHVVHRSTLPNGLRVISVPQPHLHTATLSVFVKVGSRHESARDNGISHLLEHMLFRGCARYRSAYLLNREIEELGGTLHGATHSDSTLFEVSLPPSNVERGIAIVGALFAQPSFTDLAVEKRVVREEILEYLDEDGREVDPDNVSRQLIFGGHPLGMTITGSLHNLERFAQSDLRAHMRRYYVANNMVLCVAGAVHERTVLRAALQHFGGLPSGAIVPPQARHSARGAARLCCVDSQGPQTDVRLSFTTFGANDPRYLALELLVRVLDDGMSTRLHRRVCEELGLAYEVFATLEPYEECGVLDVGAAVEHATVPVFIRHALRLLAELADKPVSKQELDKAKRRYQWQLEAILDDAQAMCTHYGQRALLGQDGHLGALRAQVQSTTAAQLRAVASEILQRSRLHAVAVGTLDRKQRQAVKRALLTLGPSDRPSARARTRQAHTSS